MVSTIAKSGLHKSLKLSYRTLRIVASFTLSILPGTAHLLRVMPLARAQKWHLGGVVADRLGPVAGMRKIVRMAGGFKMDLDLNESYERRMYYSRLYAPHLASLFKHLLLPGDTVIDGGANIGYFSLLAARYVGEHGSVHSFEPVLQTFEVLNENIRLNRYTTIHTNRLALTQSAGEVCLEVPMDTQTGNPVGRLAKIAQLCRGPQVTVPAGTLDEYVAHSGINLIKLVKLDIEGSESAAIEGMRQILSEHRVSYLICEISTHLLDEMGVPYSTLQKTLKECGYRCYLIKCGSAWICAEPIDLVATSLEDTLSIYGDYLFVAPGMTVPGNMTT